MDVNVNVNGNVTLTIQPSDSLVALFGSLIGSNAQSATAIKTTTAKGDKKALKIEEKPVETATQETTETPAPETTTVIPEGIKTHTLEEVTNVVRAYLGTTPTDEKRNNIKALNDRFGGKISDIFTKLTPAQVADYVLQVKALG